MLVWHRSPTSYSVKTEELPIGRTFPRVTIELECPKYWMTLFRSTNSHWLYNTATLWVSHPLAFLSIIISYADEISVPNGVQYLVTRYAFFKY